MTLALALRGASAMVLAADSRGTIGDPRGLTAIDDSHVKVFKLTRFAGIGIAGASELASRLIDGLRPKLTQPDADVDAVLALSMAHFKAEFSAWFGGPRPWFGGAQINDHRPVINFILTGYANAAPAGAPPAITTPRTYLLSSQVDFAPQLSPAGNMLIGVPQYAIYLLNRFYQPDLGPNAVRALAAFLIAETASQDPKVGGPIRMAEITPGGGYVDVPAGAIQGLVQENAQQSQNLREFFRQRDAIV